MDAVACLVFPMILVLPKKSATFATMMTMSGAAKNTISALLRLNQQTRSPKAGRYGLSSSLELSVVTAVATNAAVMAQT